jgi:4-diphosphocytidyl-2-C-methyl-D-erythritol kinase
MRINCNAKINLGLYVTEKRKDGFHNLESIFLPIPWYDVVDIQKAEKTSFSSSGIKIDGESSSNLCLKAYQLLAQEFIMPPVAIHLEKNIPIGAGLGGGSSDAAYVLKGLNELFQLNLSTDKLKKLAAELGSDCPFFIENKAAFVTGRGEELTTDLSLQLNCYCLVVNPGIHISTKEAYSNIIPQKSPFNLLTLNELPQNDWQGIVSNDFEKALETRHLPLQKVRAELQKLSPFYISMSGSGSTYFALLSKKPIGYDFGELSAKCFKLSINQ